MLLKIASSGLASAPQTKMRADFQKVLDASQIFQFGA